MYYANWFGPGGGRGCRGGQDSKSAGQNGEDKNGVMLEKKLFQDVKYVGDIKAKYIPLYKHLLPIHNGLQVFTCMNRLLIL